MPEVPGAGGGGGVLIPNFGRYVPRQSEKWARAPDRAPRSSVKMGGSGPNLSRFERETAGLRTDLEPFSAWKCGSPELPGRVWLALWPAAKPGRCRTLCVRAEPAVGGGERVEIKEILKMMVSGTAKNVKWRCSRPDLFGHLWKWYAPERKFRAENGGLSRGTYPIPGPEILWTGTFEFPLSNPLSKMKISFGKISKWNC